MTFYEGVQDNLIFSKTVKDTTKRVTLCESRQYLLLMAPVLISDAVLCIGNVRPDIIDF